MVTVQLVCVCDFAYANAGFFHDTAHMFIMFILCSVLKLKNMSIYHKVPCFWINMPK